MLKKIFKIICLPKKRCGSADSGFSLAEATITLAILGVIAAITIPSVISKNVDAKRVKLKKAVEVYSNAIVTITSENSIKANTNQLDIWGRENNCANVRQYFKIIQDGETPCQFRTSDGIWWSFGPDTESKYNGRLSKALVAFKKADLKKKKAIDDETNDAFFLTTLFDSKQKARIFDVAYNNFVGDSAAIINTAKVYAFINKDEMKKYFVFCKKNENTSCVNHLCVVNDQKKYTCTQAFYNNNGNLTTTRSGCKENIKGCIGGDMKTKDLGNDTIFNGNCDSQGSDCNYYIREIKYISEWKSKGDAPDFDKDKNDTSIYSKFKQQSSGTKYTDCDVNATSKNDCDTSNRFYNLLYAIPDDPNGAYMNVYYTTDDNENKKITSAYISYYPDSTNPQVPINAISYSDCTGWSLSSCTCKSKSTDYPCPY